MSFSFMPSFRGFYLWLVINLILIGLLSFSNFFRKRGPFYKKSKGHDKHSSSCEHQFGYHKFNPCIFIDMEMIIMIIMFIIVIILYHWYQHYHHMMATFQTLLVADSMKEISSKWEVFESEREHPSLRLSVNTGSKWTP